jgi:hypothetical protein
MVPIDEVLGALKRMRHWKEALCDALAQLIGYVERHRPGLLGPAEDS